MAKGCYTAKYLTASYKGVSFFAEEATSNHGRRGAEGEFPFSENTAYADLGRKIRKYTLQGRFQENTHVQDAAAFIAVCESPGPGILIHPTRGALLSVACQEVSISDKVEESGGVTYVDISFVEAVSQTAGFSFLGQVGGIIISGIIAAARSSFVASYRPNQVQSFLEVSVINSGQSQLSNVIAEYASASSGVIADSERSRSINDLTRVASSDSLAGDPETLDTAISLGLNAIAGAVKSEDQYEVFRRLANGSAMSSILPDPARASEDAVYSLVRILSAAYMAEGATQAPNHRTGEIFTQLDAINAILETEIEIARAGHNNDLFLSLTAFKNEASSALSDMAYNAPGLVRFNLGGTAHPLVAAYVIHGDAKRVRDIERLNLVGPFGRVGPDVVGMGL